MVSAADVKYYLSGGASNSSKSASLGGDRSTTTTIITAVAGNLFADIGANDSVIGKTYYRNFYIVNGHATEVMKNCSLFMQSGAQIAQTQWGFETSKYKYAPWGTYNGTSDRTDIADAAPLDLAQFTVAIWFRTTKDYSGGEGALINKGGYGSATPGQNLNYGIRIVTTNKINVGYEDAADVKYNVDSATTLNDGIWHRAVLTYDGVTIKCYIDGALSNSVASAGVPEQNNNNLTLGANARASDRFFQGQLDEAYVVNRAWTLAEVQSDYNDNDPPNDGIVYQNTFGDYDNNNSSVSQIIANETTAPVGIVWQDPTNAPTTPNVGDIKPSTYGISVWVKRILPANSSDSELDNCVFKLRGQIPDSGTAPGGDDQGGGGGTGGGTPPPAQTAFNISASADWDANSTTKKVVSLIKGFNPEVVLSMGDEHYGAKLSDFYSVISPLDNKNGIIMKGTVGNHDKGSDIKTHWGVQNTYYSFDFQNTHFICLDTETSMSKGSAQYNFVLADLKAARSNPNIFWVIAFMHKPFYTANNSHHSSNENGQVDAFGKMFDDFKVDFILQGHVHSMQSSKQITFNSSDKLNPIVVASSSPYTKGVGRFFIICGTGGHDSGSSLYKLTNSPSFNAFQNDSDNGAINLIYSNSNKTVTVEFRNISNELLYSFVVNG